VRRLTILAFAILGLTACGGSSGTTKTVTTTSTPATSAAAIKSFVDAGNKVCMDADKRVLKIGRLTRNPKGWALTAAAARRGVREMQAVKPPAGRAAGFAQLLRYANALALSLQEIKVSLVKGDVDTAAAAQFAAAKFQDKVHSTAKTVGLTFCQQQLTNWPA
jgi:hypothetical protein